MLRTVISFTVLFLGILKKGPDPTLTFKRWAIKIFLGHLINIKHPSNICLCITILREPWGSTLICVNAKFAGFLQSRALEIALYPCPEDNRILSFTPYRRELSIALQKTDEMNDDQWGRHTMFYDWPANTLQTLLIILTTDGQEPLSVLYCRGNHPLLAKFLSLQIQKSIYRVAEVLTCPWSECW